MLIHSHSARDKGIVTAVADELGTANVKLDSETRCCSRPVPLRRTPKTHSITHRLWFPVAETRGARQSRRCDFRWEVTGFIVMTRRKTSLEVDTTEAASTVQVARARSRIAIVGVLSAGE